MDLQDFVSLFRDYGATFNLLRGLKYQCDDLEDEILECSTSCCETTDVLTDLLTNGEAKVLDFDSDLSDDTFIVVTLNDIAEAGSHYAGIITTSMRCYLIQSFERRYSVKVDEYPDIRMLFDDLEDLLKEPTVLRKIDSYNRLTHNNVTCEASLIFLDPRYHRDQSIDLEGFNLKIPTSHDLKTWVQKSFRSLPKNTQDTINHDVVSLLSAIDRH